MKTGQDVINIIIRNSDNSINENGIDNNTILDMINQSLAEIFDSYKWNFLRKNYEVVVNNLSIDLPGDFESIANNYQMDRGGIYNSAKLLVDEYVLSLYSNDPQVKGEYAYIEDNKIKIRINSLTINGKTAKMKYYKKPDYFTLTTGSSLPDNFALLPAYDVLTMAEIIIKEDPTYNNKKVWREFYDRTFSRLLQYNVKNK